MLNLSHSATFASFKRDKKRLPTHSEKLENRLTDALNLACMTLLLVKVVKHLKHIPQSSEYFYTSLQNFSIPSAGEKQEAIAVSGPTEHCTIFHFPPPFVRPFVTGVTYQLFSIF